MDLCIISIDEGNTQIIKENYGGICLRIAPYNVIE